MPGFRLRHCCRYSGVFSLSFASFKEKYGYYTYQGDNGSQFKVVINTLYESLLRNISLENILGLSCCMLAGITRYSRNISLQMIYHGMINRRIRLKCFTIQLGMQRDTGGKYRSE